MWSWSRPGGSVRPVPPSVLHRCPPGQPPRRGVRGAVATRVEAGQGCILEELAHWAEALKAEENVVDQDQSGEGQGDLYRLVDPADKGGLPADGGGK